LGALAHGGLDGSVEYSSLLKVKIQETAMIFRLCIVFATAIAILSPAALASFS